MIFRFNINFLQNIFCKKFFLFIFLISICNQTLHAENSIKNIPEDLDISASSLDYDIKNQTFIASGNVTLKINDKILTADKILYNAKSFILSAYGNVNYKDAQNNIVNAESLVLDKQTDIILIQKVNIVFQNYATLQAQEALKNDQNAYYLKNGTFYYILPTEPYVKPNTVIKFSKGSYYHKDRIIQFQNAVLYLYGIPIFWTPFISFDDLSLQRKSGFLFPSIKYTSYMGTYILLPYYFPINKSNELFFKIYAPIKSPKNSILELEYFGFLPKNQANIKVNYLNQDNNKESQWLIFANDTFNFNKYIKLTAQIQKTSNLDYLRNYNPDYIATDISYLNTELKTEVYFNNDNYFSIAYNNYDYINNLFLTVNKFTTDFTVNYNFMKNSAKFGNFFINNQSSLFLDTNYNSLFRTASNIKYSYINKKPFGEITFESIIQYALYSFNSYDSTYNLNNQTINNIKLDNYLAGGIAFSYEYPILIPKKTYAIKISPIIQLSLSDYLIGTSNSSVLDSFDEKITHNNLFNINYYSGFDKFTRSKNVKYGIKFQTNNQYRTTTDMFVGKLINLSKNTDLYNISPSNENGSPSQTNNLFDYYYIYANLFPTASTIISYQGIISAKNFKVKENTLTFGYYSPLLSLSSKYTQYFDLNKNIYNYSYMNELKSDLYVKINPHLQAGVQTTHLNNSTNPFALRYLTYSVLWIDNNIKVKLSIKQDFHANNINKLNFNFQISIFNFNIKNSDD